MRNFPRSYYQCPDLASQQGPVSRPLVIALHDADPSEPVHGVNEDKYRRKLLSISSRVYSTQSP